MVVLSYHGRRARPASGSPSWRLGCSRRTPCICSERTLRAVRRAHAAADAPQQPQRAAGPLRPEDAEQSPDPPLDRRDQMMRPVEPHQHVFVEPAEPSAASAAWACVTSNTKAVTATPTSLASTRTMPAAIQCLCARSHSPSSLNGNSTATGTTNTTSERDRRQLADDAGDPGLDRPQRDARDDPFDERLEMTPQPRLDQEDDREQDQQRAGQSAHDTNLGSSRARHKAPASIWVAPQARRFNCEPGRRRR